MGSLSTIAWTHFIAFWLRLMCWSQVSEPQSVCETLDFGHYFCRIVEVTGWTKRLDDIWNVSHSIGGLFCFVVSMAGTIPMRWLVVSPSRYRFRHSLSPWIIVKSGRIVSRMATSRYVCFIRKQGSKLEKRDGSARVLDVSSLLSLPRPY